MEEAREYTAVSPQTYANVWKLIGALTVAGFAAWLFWPAKELWPTKERGQMYGAFGWTWELEEHSWVELDGFYRLGVILIPVRAKRNEETIHFEEDTWRGLCGAVLSLLPDLPNDALHRKDVYRVSINVRKPDGSLVLQRNMPVPVENGACLGASNGVFLFRYPGELSGWNLKRYEIDKKYSLFGSECSTELEVIFVWAREGKGDSGSFPFQKACNAVLNDIPFELLGVLGPEAETANKPDLILVKAGREIGGVLIHAGTYQTQTFKIAGNLCVLEDAGEPT